MRLLPLWLYRVAGNSMLPLYRPGDIVMGWRWFRLRPGRVVVARYNHVLIIKRLTKLEDQKIWLEGDNALESTDSRHYGPIGRQQLEAMIVAVLFRG